MVMGAIHWLLRLRRKFTDNPDPKVLRSRRHTYLEFSTILWGHKRGGPGLHGPCVVLAGAKAAEHGLGDQQGPPGERPDEQVQSSKKSNRGEGHSPEEPGYTRGEGHSPGRTGVHWEELWLTGKNRGSLGRTVVHQARSPDLTPAQDSYCS